MSKSYEAFMKPDTGRYEGEFIGMCEGGLIAHSESLEEVYAATNAACGRKYTPFISQVLPAERIILR